MESPLNSFMENIMFSNKGVTSDKMTSSCNSTMEDTTPSDSGVQTLDSESSELMVESITSQNGFEFEESNKFLAQVDKKNEVSANIYVENIIDTVVPANINCERSAHVDNNFNVTNEIPTTPPIGIEDAMATSACSTFDTTENIVYRRKARKVVSGTPKAPKKRVSFHEDILKNTRTDNIHIEHGFITYKTGRKMNGFDKGLAGRYSWCSEGEGRNETSAVTTSLAESELHGDGDEYCDRNGKGRRRCVVYRNACSDVLDYGDSDIYDTNESKNLNYDNSGVFEYVSNTSGLNRNENNLKKGDNQVDEFCRCSCSSSNSSLDGDENDKNCNRQQYGQSKSSSCDCIGSNNANNNIIGENCYFSEPNIGNIKEMPYKKSVWNKEKKPKSSCLKKRYTNIIHEQDLSTKVKKFNVHDMNQLIDNSSKIIIGSLKSIFTLPLTERGLPEGSEDLQPVAECIPELEQTPEHKTKVATDTERKFSSSPPLKNKPFLSKSLDGSKSQQGVKKFVHNVDEQLRRKNEGELYAPTRQSSDVNKQNDVLTVELSKTLKRQEEIDGATFGADSVELKPDEKQLLDQKQFRSKFIINCESTVFEHTGVSYNYEGSPLNAFETPKESPSTKLESEQMQNSFISAPIAKTFSSFFRSFKSDQRTYSPITQNFLQQTNEDVERADDCFESKAHTNTVTPLEKNSSKTADISNTSCSLKTEPAKITKMQNVHSNQNLSVFSSSLVIGQDFRNNLDQKSRHLPSPLKKRNSHTQPQRYGANNNASLSDYNSLLSPDLFNGYYGGISRGVGGSGRDSKSTILSEEFDDILTITTEDDTNTDKNESDIVILDYPTASELMDSRISAESGNMLKIPQPTPAAKTSLINRFLRNVTQKKMLESSVRRNSFFNTKLKREQKLFSENLYVRGVKPKNYELIEDLNAEIAMEIEMSGVNSPRRELASIGFDLPNETSKFELGIGEISIDIFNGNHLHILNNQNEQLMKVFKLYTGYSCEGFMTPVLVFLTDKTLYVTDLVRNRLCSKFVLPYADLDVILMGPFGNTVLLSNSERDMQQVLLAAGPYPADGLVANIELCARRGGSVLPAVGQLTLDHLAPLQTFVRTNSNIDKADTWVYYAVVNIPAGMIGNDQEPLGPHVKGFLMYRKVSEHTIGVKQSWKPGYFLLKAGVLYMFNDSTQKLPNWAMALAECQGAKRTTKAERPHCFEVMLKGEILQLAAPDEYVASEWLQGLLQSASGLFEMQEKHKTLGCTLVVTQNHLITLREDFTMPLRQTDMENTSAVNTVDVRKEGMDILERAEASSLLSSAMSTPSKGTLLSCSSINSTPTKISQISSSTITSNPPTSSSILHSSAQFPSNYNKKIQTEVKESYTKMSSVYGKNAGLEILTCANIREIIGIKIPSLNNTWWCVLEFSCQEVRESSGDLIIFFASSSEMQRFLRLLEQLWQAKNNDLFPITVLDEEDIIAEQCSTLYMAINRSWEPLISAALGYPL